jgi:hypothetical protein
MYGVVDSFVGLHSKSRKRQNTTKQAVNDDPRQVKPRPIHSTVELNNKRRRDHDIGEALFTCVQSLSHFLHQSLTHEQIVTRCYHLPRPRMKEQNYLMH